MIKLIFRQFEISISHITGECADKSSKDMASSRNLVSTIGALANH